MYLFSPFPLHLSLETVETLALFQEIWKSEILTIYALLLQT